MNVNKKTLLLQINNKHKNFGPYFET
jgi:hypothetical protein